MTLNAPIPDWLLWIVGVALLGIAVGLCSAQPDRAHRLDTLEQRVEALERNELPVG